jgi:dihydroorotate dehydrogenase (fumarate)
MTVDLKTTYLGLELDTPLVSAASPLGRTIEGLHRLEDAGISAIVLPSLFEEQIEHDSYQVHEVLEYGAELSAETFGGYLPEYEAYNTGPERYIDLVRQARAEMKVPVIASLNGVTVRPGLRRWNWMSTSSPPTWTRPALRWSSGTWIWSRPCARR